MKGLITYFVVVAVAVTFADVEETAHVVKPEKCLTIANGEIVDEGRSVNCNPGYTLDNKRYHRYSCECDVSNMRNPFTCVAKRPKCKPDSCTIPSFNETRMTVEQIRGKNKKHLPSNDDSVRHGTQVRFHCSVAGDTFYEPSNRVFKCDKGSWNKLNWQWNFDNNGAFPICREGCTFISAQCSCSADGKCVRDNACACPRFTRGNQCKRHMTTGFCRVFLHLRNGRSIKAYDRRGQFLQFHCDSGYVSNVPKLGIIKFICKFDENAGKYYIQARRDVVRRGIRYGRLNLTDVLCEGG